MRDIYFHLYRRIQSNKRYIRLDNNKMESKIFNDDKKKLLLFFSNVIYPFLKLRFLKR